MKTKEDFSRVLSASSDKSQRIKIEKIKFKKISKNMGRARVTLSFNNLTTGALVGMVKNLAHQYKVKVAQVRISKDEILKTLKGNMELVFYSAINLLENDK